MYNTLYFGTANVAHTEWAEEAQSLQIQHGFSGFSFNLPRVIGQMKLKCKKK